MGRGPVGQQPALGLRGLLAVLLRVLLSRMLALVGGRWTRDAGQEAGQEVAAAQRLQTREAWPRFPPAAWRREMGWVIRARGQRPSPAQRSGGRELLARPPACWAQPCGVEGQAGRCSRAPLAVPGQVGLTPEPAPVDAWPWLRNTGGDRLRRGQRLRAPSLSLFERKGSRKRESSMKPTQLSPLSTFPLLPFFSPFITLFWPSGSSKC